MTIRDLIAMEIDIDVYDDVCEELGIAFCGPAVLTEEGRKEFADIMDYHVTFNRDCSTAVVHVDDPDDAVWKHRLYRAKLFFDSAAGYCPVDEYERWFADDEES